MKAPAAPCRATCVSGSLPYFFKSITGTFVLGAFLLEIMARMILSGCFRHEIEYIDNDNVHSIGPFSCVVTAGQLTGQLNLFTVRLHHNIIKETSLNE